MMLKAVVYYIFVCVLQLWWPDFFSVFGISFDFVFMAFITANVIFTPVAALFFSFFAGLFADFNSWGHFGVYTLTYIVLSYVISYIKKGSDLYNPFTRNIVFIAAYFMSLIIYSFMFFAIYKYWFFDWKNFVIAPILNILLFEIFFAVTQRFLSEKKCLS